jgi:hypothetical protein
MNLDYVLFGLILCGAGLAGACFRSEYVLLRELKATERRRERLMRELHLDRLSAQGGDRLSAQDGDRRTATQTAVMNPAQLAIDEVARPEDA